MAYPDQYCKIVLAGTLPGGEHWSTTFGVNPFTNLDQTGLSGLLSELNTVLAAGGGFFSQFSLINPAQVTIATITGYQYQGGPKAAVQAQVTASYTPSATAPIMPNQVCAVASLRSTLPGRANRGRMYLPALKVVMGTNGIASDGNLGSVAQGLATSFGAFNSSGEGKIVIGSQVTGLMHQVSYIQIDAILDTQRRRRDKLTTTITNQKTVAL